MGSPVSTVGNTLTDKHWRNLLTDIEVRQVIPVVGAELVVLDQNDGQTTLYQHLARELVARLEIDEERLPEAYSLFDVTSLFLQDHSDQAEDLHYETREVLNSRSWPTPEPLRKLSAIKHFDLFVSSTIDSLLEQALNEVRFGGINATRTIAYSEKSQVQDLPADYEAAGKPTIFQLFGKLNATGDYAITEEKVLEFSHRLQSRDLRPQNLFDVFRNRNLLVLGCSFPGWLARFFLRATKGDQLFTQGARGVVADRASHRDQEFVMFLGRRKTILYSQGDGVAFVDELHRRWTEKFLSKPSPDPPAPQPSHELSEFKTDSVFISYANEDRPEAEQVKEAFDREGVDVWFDRRALRAGDDFRLEIDRNIENCSYFVPLISKHTASLEKRFFHREWNKAIEESASYPREYPFIQPVITDGTAIDAQGIPREFGARHFRRLEDLSELVEDAKRRIRERRRERRIT